MENSVSLIVSIFALIFSVVTYRYSLTIETKKTTLSVLSKIRKKHPKKP